MPRGEHFKEGMGGLEGVITENDLDAVLEVFGMVVCFIGMKFCLNNLECSAVIKRPVFIDPRGRNPPTPDATTASCSKKWGKGPPFPFGVQTRACVASPLSHFEPRSASINSVPPRHVQRRGPKAKRRLL